MIGIQLNLNCDFGGDIDAPCQSKIDWVKQAEYKPGFISVVPSMPAGWTALQTTEYGYRLICPAHKVTITAPEPT